MVAVDEIKALIVQKAKASPEIAGSVIGLMLRRHFPALDMKQAYGGLRKFIEQYCAEDVNWLRKHGGDDIYQYRYGHASSPTSTAARISVNGTDNLVRSLGPAKQNYWQAFSNPNIAETVVIDKRTGELFITPPNSDLEEFHLRLNKISRDEYRQMAWDFLTSLAEPQRNEFRQVLSFDDFWPHWSALMWKHKADGVFDQWIKWRNQQIHRLFESRLEQVELPSGVAAAATDQLKRKPITRNLTNEFRSRSNYSRLQQLRSVIHRAVDRMGADELRRIWLPVGTIVDSEEL